MIAGRIKVTMQDGATHEAKPLPGDLVRLERHFGVRFGQVAVEGLGVDHLAYLAWSPLRRAGKVTVEFDTFIDELAEMDFATLEAATPTSPAP